MIIYSRDGWDVLYIPAINDYVVLDDNSDVIVDCYSDKNLAIEICKNHSIVI